MVDQNNSDGLAVILDSNIWLHERMLRHSVGSAVRFFLNKRNARVVVPEVVRREVELHLEEELLQLASRLRRDYERLLGYVGSLKELVLPTDEELAEVAASAFSSVGVEVTDHPFSHESARSSLEKCLRSEPPNRPKNQQFKDGVIWADCLEIAREQQVLFVTGDKAFFRDNDYAKGLAENLANEAGELPHEIAVAHDISAVLERMSTAIDLDLSTLVEEFTLLFYDQFDSLVSFQGYFFDSMIGGEHAVFATVDPGVGHVEFSCRCRCTHPSRPDGTLSVRGKCEIHPATGRLTRFRRQGEDFRFHSSDGEQTVSNHVVFMEPASYGHRTTQHRVRFPVSDVRDN